MAFPTRRAFDPSFLTGYGVAHFGKSLLWHCSELLFTFFLTEACGLSPMMAVAILSGSLFLNAAADALLGSYLSRRMATITAAGRLQVAGVLVASAAFMAFGATGLVPPQLRPGFAIVAMVIFRLSYPVVDVAQNTMLALATRCDAGRAKLSSQRYIYGGLADVAVAMAFAPLFMGYSPDARAWHFMLLSAGIAVIAIAGSIALRRALAIDPVPVVGGMADAPTSAMASESAIVWHWSRVIFPMIFALSLASAGFARLVPYMAAFMLRIPTSAAGLVVGISLANVVSQSFWAWLATRTSLGAVFSLAAALTMTSGIVLLATGGEDLAWHMLFIAAYGAGSGGMRMSLWALAAARSALRPHASFRTFGLLTACSKCGIACGAIAAAALLSSADYRAEAAWHGTLLSLASLLPLASGLLMLISIQLIKRFQS